MSAPADLLVLLAQLWLAGASVALAGIDLALRRLPDRIVLPTIVVLAALLAAASALRHDPEPLLRALAGGAALLAGHLLLALVSRGGLGLGDVKLSAALGLATAWVGWEALVLGAVASFLLGGAVGGGLLLARRARRRTALPFGPWMLAGAWIGILAGPAAASWTAAALGPAAAA